MVQQEVRTPPEIVDDIVDFDPAAPPESSFEFIGRVTDFNHYVRAREEYAAEASGARPIQWRQEFEALDFVREDGSPAMFSNNTNLTRGDGITQLGEGSASHTLGLAWQAATKSLVPPNGISMNPRDPRSSSLTGHVFRFKSQTLKLGKNKKGEELKKRIYAPIEYLGGPDFVYFGDKKTIRSRSDETDNGVPSVPSIPTIPAEAESETLGKIAEALAGATRATAYDVMLKSPLRLAEVGGDNVLDALNPAQSPNLIDRLLEDGLMVLHEDGTLTAVAD